MEISNTRKISQFLGVLAGFGVLIIWSSWAVASKYGLSDNGINQIHLMFVRFFSSSLIVVIPFFPQIRSMHTRELLKIVLVSMLGGSSYLFFVFLGIQETSASISVFLVNGLMPITTFVISYYFLSSSISFLKSISFVILLVANYLLISQSNISIFSFLYLLLATISLSLYSVFLHRYDIKVRDIVFFIPIVNLLTILPFFLLNNPLSILQINFSSILIQFIFQGVLAGFFAVILFAYCIKKAGIFTASVIMSLVPILTFGLEVFLLKVQYSSHFIISLILCVIALLLYAFSFRTNNSIAD